MHTQKVDMLKAAFLDSETPALSPLTPCAIKSISWLLYKYCGRECEGQREPAASVSSGNEPTL